MKQRASFKQWTFPAAAWRWVCRHPWVAVALVLFGLALATFGELAEDLSAGGLGRFDRLVVGIVRAHPSPPLFLIARVFSAVLGWPALPGWLALLVVLLWLHRQRLLALALAVIPTATSLLIEGLKAIFQRARPLTALVYALGHSFPSGHAAGAVVTYGLLAYIAWRCCVRGGRARLLIVLLAVLLILATGLSRIYLMVHYPSDVVAGWAAGTCILTGSLVLLESYRRREHRAR